MEGGKLNSAAKEDINEIMTIGGEEYIFYKSFPIHIAIIRGTTADENGNLTIEQEALKLEILETAMAAKDAGGKVIAQVLRVASNGTLKAKDVVVPGELVDAVVVAEEPELYHKQTRNFYSPYLSGELRMPPGAAAKPPEKLEAADVVCRRAVYELLPGAVVTSAWASGAGGQRASVEGNEDKIRLPWSWALSAEPPTPISDFGATVKSTASMHTSCLTSTTAAGLDITFWGREFDGSGNVT
jgi:propionate CoA-transferase